jgi:hypothetical protein
MWVDNTTMDLGEIGFRRGGALELSGSGQSQVQTSCKYGNEPSGSIKCWEVLEWLHLQNKVLRTTGSFPRRTSVRDMHVAFQIPYVYGYITKLCRQQAEVIQNHENENVRSIGQGETPHRKYKRLKLGGGHVYDCSSV